MAETTNSSPNRSSLPGTSTQLHLLKFRGCYDPMHISGPFYCSMSQTMRNTTIPCLYEARLRGCPEERAGHA